MRKNLEIEKFKSIKYLKLDCRKVNIFIGKPNAGKSNILESIGIFSLPFVGELKGLIRFENMPNLFYDNELSEKLKITFDEAVCEIRFENGRFIGQGTKGTFVDFEFDIDYLGRGNYSLYPGISPVKFYKFMVKSQFPDQKADFLLPPDGNNLLQILLTNKGLRRLVADVFTEFSLRIVLKPQESKIEVQKEIDEVIITSPYSLISDTLQRIIFYLIAVETNKDSIIIFEEPEAHAFPYYTKFLAERIAQDPTNQYFISTHNPYLLLPLIEKTPKETMAIFITYFEDYQTKIRALTEEELSSVLDFDSSIFFNLDRFQEEI